MNDNFLTGTGQTGTFTYQGKPQNRKQKQVQTLPFLKTQPLRDLTKSKIGTIYKQVLGGLINQGDLCIFWGSSGSGKSIFCYQLGECISQGKNFFDVMSECNFETDTGERKIYKLKNELETQKCLYIDFEMSDDQIYGRYKSETDKLYSHNENFIIGQFKDDLIKDKSMYIKSIEKYIQKTGIKVLIIDNMSVIGDSLDKGDNSRDMMFSIKQMRDRNNLTIILVSHTNKINSLDPKTENMVKGSANNMNFVDSMFCLSRTTKDNHIRYLIQQKCRVGEETFKGDNVIEIELNKDKENGNIGFVFNGYSTETDMLKEMNTDIRQLLKQDIKNLIETEQNITYYQISKKLFNSHGNGVKEQTFLKQCERIFKLIKRENEK